MLFLSTHMDSLFTSGHYEVIMTPGFPFFFSEFRNQIFESVTCRHLCSFSFLCEVLAKTVNAPEAPVEMQLN